MAAVPEQPVRRVSEADLAGDLVARDHPMFGVVWVNPERLGGTPCFFGTRVPIKNLFDYLGAGQTVDGFLEDFPGVAREQVDAVLARAPEVMMLRGRAA